MSQKCCEPQPPFILFADDDPDTLNLLSFAAQQRGWMVDTASRAREVLEKFNEHCSGTGHCYDALVMDVNFRNAPGEEHEPRLTGVTVAKEIRRAFLNIPIVFFTGADSYLVRKQTQAAGGPMSEFVTKPGDIQSLLNRVEYLMAWVSKSATYEGPDRRVRSINRTGFARRAADKTMTVPMILEKVLTKAKNSALGNGGEK